MKVSISSTFVFSDSDIWNRFKTKWNKMTKTAMEQAASLAGGMDTKDTSHQSITITFMKTTQDFSIKVRIQTSLRSREWRWRILTVYQRRCQVLKNSNHQASTNQSLRTFYTPIRGRLDRTWQICMSILIIWTNSSTRRRIKNT